MIKIRAYESGDAYKIKPRMVFNNDPTLLDRVEALAGNLDSYSNTFLNENEEVIAIVGLTLLWPRVADIWAVISDDVKKSPISFHKRIKHALSFYSEKLDIKRYQVFVQSEYSDGCKWMKVLGFKVEGLLEKFGPEGKDYYIMGRIN